MVCRLPRLAVNMSCHGVNSIHFHGCCSAREQRPGSATADGGLQLASSSKIGSSPIFPSLGNPVECCFRPDRSCFPSPEHHQSSRVGSTPGEKQITIEEPSTSGTNAVACTPETYLKVAWTNRSTPPYNVRLLGCWTLHGQLQPCIKVYVQSSRSWLHS